jgi:hypothetical protein
MELILGIAPMSQYDAAATPMWRCFTNTADGTPFQSLPANVNLEEKNTASNEWSRKSSNIDLTREDRVPDALFNEILWKAIKGADAPLPAPSRAAFVKISPVKDSD